MLRLVRHISWPRPRLSQNGRSLATWTIVILKTLLTLNTLSRLHDLLRLFATCRTHPKHPKVLSSRRNPYWLSCNRGTMADGWVVDISQTISTAQTTTSPPMPSPTRPLANLAQTSPSNIRLSNGVLGGIIAASVIVVVLLTILLWYLCRSHGRAKAAKAIDSDGSDGSAGIDAEGPSRGETSFNRPLGDNLAELEPRGRDPTPRPLLATTVEDQAEPTRAALHKSSGPDKRRSGREPRFSEE